MEFLHYLIFVPMAVAIIFLLSSNDLTVRVVSFVALVVLEQARDVLSVREISRSLSAKKIKQK